MSDLHDEKTLSGRTVYEGRVFRVESLVVRLPDGRSASRDVLRHSGGACVVPLEPDGRIHLVRQFRTAIGRTMLEIPAGKLDPGEPPLACAVRELREETGLSASDIALLGSIHPTPGYSDERLYIYLATGLSRGETRMDEDEFLSHETHSLESCLQMVEDGTITDSKTVVGILATARKVRDGGKGVGHGGTEVR